MKLEITGVPKSVMMGVVAQSYPSLDVSAWETFPDKWAPKEMRELYAEIRALRFALNPVRMVRTPSGGRHPEEDSTYSWIEKRLQVAGRRYMEVAKDAGWPIPTGDDEWSLAITWDGHVGMTSYTGDGFFIGWEGERWFKCSCSRTEAVAMLEKLEPLRFDYEIRVTTEHWGINRFQPGFQYVQGVRYTTIPHAIEAIKEKSLQTV